MGGIAFAAVTQLALGLIFRETQAYWETARTVAFAVLGLLWGFFEHRRAVKRATTAAADPLVITPKPSPASSRTLARLE